MPWGELGRRFKPSYAHMYSEYSHSVAANLVCCPQIAASLVCWQSVTQLDVFPCVKVRRAPEKPFEVFPILAIAGQSLCCQADESVTANPEEPLRQREAYQWRVESVTGLLARESA